MKARDYRKFSANPHSKYHSKKTVVDGIKFDSKKEAARWSELKALEKSGKIKNLQRQVKFVLIPTQKDENGKVIERECCYYADFVYIRHLGNDVYTPVVEDVKGFKTPEYVIKRKLMLKECGIRVNEI